MPPTATESSAIKVVVRLRPMNEMEKKLGSMPAVTASVESKTMTIIKGQGMARSVYSFDRVYSAFSNQADVFQGTLAPVIGDVLKGYESTVFAYGQTGTGKTYTMEGSLTAPSQYGIIPRSTEAIFTTLASPEFESSRVACSYLEIYNEELHDILTVDAAQKARLEIVNGKHGTFCRGLTEKEVKSSEDVLKLVQMAERSRKIGETKMNKQSSRSHCIFTVSVYTKRKTPDGTVDYHGKLHLVDLAGSECAKNAGLGRSSNNESTRERERMNINRSLLTLGRVISAVKSLNQGKKVRVPYRDSKLTRMLQEALGGRSKTLIIATLSPSESAISESISTLNYAQTAGGIVNKPVAASYLGGKSPRSANLNDMSDPGNTVEHWFEMECRLKYMEAQIEEAQTALSRQHVHYNAMAEKAEKSEKELIAKEEECNIAHRKIFLLEDTLTKEKKQREAVEFHLKLTETSLRKTNAILEITQSTEAKLKLEGTDLINKLKQSISDGDDMHKLLLKMRESNVQQKKATKQFHASTTIMLNDVLSKLGGISQVQEEFNTKAIKGAEDSHKQDERSLNEYLELIKDISSYIDSSAGVLKSLSVGDDGVAPTMCEFVNKMKTAVSDTGNSLSDSKEKLSESCQNARKRLQEYSLHIEEMDTESSLTLSNLAETVKLNARESKKQILEVVAKAMQAATDFRVSSFETRNDLNAVINKLKEYTLTSTKIMNDRAQRQHSAMLENLQSFSVGMQRHGEMRSELIMLNNYMNSEGYNYREIIAAQSEMINTQKEYFTHTEEKHHHLQKELTKNIINGVQELVRVETDNIAHEMHEQFLSFHKDNSNLKQLNGDMDSSVKDIFSQVAKTGNTLTEHVQAVQDNDAMMNNAAEDTNETLTEIQNLIKRDQESMLSFREEINLNLEIFETHDESLTKACNIVKKQRDEVSEFVSETTLESTTEGLSELKKRGREQTEYVTDIAISNANKDMEATQSIWDDCFTATLNRFEHLTNITEEGNSAVRDVALKQCVTTDDLSEFIHSKKSGFIENYVNKRKLEIEDRRNAMLKNVDNHTELLSSNFVETGESTKEARNKVSSFSKDVIHMDDQTPGIAKKEQIQFKDNLSFTPSAHQIIESLDMNRIHEEDSFSFHVEEHNEEEENGSFQVNDTKDEMRQDEASKGISPLSEVSINSIQPQHFHFEHGT